MRTLLLLALCTAAGASAQIGAFEDISTGSGGQPAELPVLDLVVDGAGRVHALGVLRSTAGSPLVMRSGDTWVETHASGGRALSLSPDGVAHAAHAGSHSPHGGLLRFVDGAWQPFAPGLRGLVHALAFGSHGHVFAAGHLYVPTTPGLSRVAWWDGATWTDLDAPDAVIHALVVRPNGDLVAAGQAAIGGNTYASMRWDGMAWHPMGAPTENYIEAMAMSPTGELAATGFFRPSAQVWGVARWDGTAWQPLGAGSNGQTFSLTWLSDGRLAVGGQFSSMDGTPARNLAVWDGATWRAPGDVGGPSEDVLVHRVFAHGTDLYVGGRFSVVGTRATRNLARLDASGWTGFGTAADGPFEQFLDDGTGGVYARGRFHTVQDVVTRGIVRWAEGAWQGIPDGGPWPVSAIARDAAGGLLAAGTLPGHHPDVPGGTGVMRLNAGQWTSLGGLFPGGYVRAVATSPGGDIYAAGSFYDLDSDLRAIARWDGSAWVSVGASPLDTADHLIVLADGQLVAHGTGRLPSGHVGWMFARWDGIAWHTLPPMTGYANALLARADGSFLVATDAGIRRWTGSAWQLLVSEPDAVYALRESADGSVVASVGFAPSSLYHLGDGVWRPLSEPLDGPVIALHPLAGGAWMLGGSFFSADGLVSPSVVRFTSGGVGTDGAPPAVDAALTVAPNPARTHATVRLGTTHGPATLTLHDLLGRRVATVYDGVPAPPEVLVSVAGLPAGVYVVRLASADGVRQARLVVVR